MHKIVYIRAFNLQKNMQYEGVLQKMTTDFAQPIKYYLDMGKDFIIMNNLIGKKIKIQFKGYQCLNCGSDEAIFAQGMCKKCFFESPQLGDWVMKPELSKAHLGIEDRDLAFEQEVQLKPHIVYLAKTSDIKVGVTRKSQVPYRWIDQGADSAIEILEVPNRYLAGVAEVALKQHISDKTSWQKMLKGISTEKDLLQTKATMKNLLPKDLQKYWIDENQPTILNFPIEKYPEKVKSINLLKVFDFTGILSGIKGQYLIFEDGHVFNVRNQAGNVVLFDF
jgi:hypothetical protein